MKAKNVYEDKGVRCVTGETIRPGGFFLTKRALELTNLSKAMKVLDVGCGMGATVNYLKEEHNIQAYGIDMSQKLINIGKEKYNIPLIKGQGESLPFKEDFFNGVFAECTLSLMGNSEKTLAEIYRVLKKEGYLIITDVNAKNTEYIPELKKANVGSCLRNLFDLEELISSIENIGFKILLLEDWTSLLTKLMVKIVFEYGSMGKFWNTVACNDCGDFKEKLKKCKPKYFLMICKKEG